MAIISATYSQHGHVLEIAYAQGIGIDVVVDVDGAPVGVAPELLDVLLGYPCIQEHDRESVPEAVGREPVLLLPARRVVETCTLRVAVDDAFDTVSSQPRPLFVQE